VEGFKSLRNPQDIEIRPLTVLAGVNSSGKSSVMQTLLLLKQTLDAPYDPGPLLLDGPHVSATNIEQLLSHDGSHPGVGHFGIGFAISGRPDIYLLFGKSPSGDISLLGLTTEISFGTFTQHITLSENLSSVELNSRLPGRVADDVARLFPREDSNGITWKVMRDRWALRTQVYPSETVDSSSITISVGPNLADYEREIGRIIHLPALRGNPRRNYGTAAVEGQYPGTFNKYTAGIISAWQNRSEVEQLTRLRNDLVHLGLSWTVEARKLNDASVELLVGRLPRARRGGTRDLVNIADVGFGVSQTLPVIVALIAAGRGQMVFLEQPEIHLHPRAQAAFAELLVSAVARGARVVVETHSALLLRAIQTLVARRELEPESVALHWFSRDPVSGYTDIASTYLDRFGSFGDWPEDFDEVNLRSDHDYLTAAEIAEASDR
jgi:hypothetical protein